LEAAGAVLKIDLSIKPNHYQEIQLAQIRETLCTASDRYILANLSHPIAPYRITYLFLTLSGAFQPLG